MLCPLVVCADVGSVAKGNFGWWSSTKESGNSPATLATHVANALNDGTPVALGFECPLFVPLVEDEQKLTSARPGEGNRAWSAGAGCGALATGLVQVAWVLQAIRRQILCPVPAFVDWASFASSGSGLLLWEAFVTGPSKLTSHTEDAQAGAEAFLQALPNPPQRNAIDCESDVYSLVGAALLRTGWCTDPEILQQACLVLRGGEDS